MAFNERFRAAALTDAQLDRAAGGLIDDEELLEFRKTARRAPGPVPAPIFDWYGDD